jgi:hypothetical protein
MRFVTRTRLGIALLVVAGALGVAAFAFGGHGGEDHPPGHEGHTMTMGAMGGAHPVAGSFKPDATLLDDCAADDQRCFEQAFGNLAFTEGPKQAIARFEATAETNDTVRSGCHRIVHMIGSASLARLHGDVAQAFALGSATCWSGYYHGILERAFADIGSPDDAKAVARKLCDDPDIEKTTFLLYQCVHGLGHGLMIYSAYNLPWALDICDALATGWDQASCTGGVFMENISSSYGVKSNWVRDDDPVYPCRDMKERHKLYCYLMVTSRINQLNGFDWKQTVDTCRTVEQDWVTTCFESYGRDASGWTVEEPGKIAPLCRLAGRFEKSCVYGAVRDLASYDPSGKKAAAFCSVVADRLRERCWNGVGTIVASLYPDAAAKGNACRRAPAAYEPSCRFGAGLT